VQIIVTVAVVSAFILLCFSQTIAEQWWSLLLHDIEVQYLSVLWNIKESKPVLQQKHLHLKFAKPDISVLAAHLVFLNLVVITVQVFISLQKSLLGRPVCFTDLFL